MKLKTAFQDENFKLGEVADVSMATMPDGRIVARATAKVGGEYTFYYDSLEAVYNDWKDYEEPKEEYWYISNGGKVYGFNEYFVDSQIEDDHREIGNLFETKEEAEKAVEKLKAWKRLKDKGFRFDHIRSIDGVSIKYKDLDQYTIIAYADEDGCDQECLDLLFGGEE